MSRSKARSSVGTPFSGAQRQAQATAGRAGSSPRASWSGRPSACGGTGMPFQTRTTRSAGISALSTWRRATKSLTAKTTSATINGEPAQGPLHRPSNALGDGARAGGVVMDDDVADAREPRRGIADGAGRLVGQVHGRDALPPDEGHRVANRPERLQRGVELDGDGGAAGQRPGRIDDLRIGDQGADAARGEPACDLGVETFDEVPRVPRVRRVIAHAEQRVLGRGGRQTMLVYTPKFRAFSCVRRRAAAPFPRT